MSCVPFPLGETVARWLDDQLVTFVKTYVALQRDTFFLENFPDK